MTTFTDPENGQELPAPRVLRRSKAHKVFGGVAGGLGERFDMDPNIFRVLFVATCALWGLGVAAYLALWVFVPRDDVELEKEQLVQSDSKRLLVSVIAGSVLLLVMVRLALGRGVFAAPGLAALWLLFIIGLAITALTTRAKRITWRRVFGLLILAAVTIIIFAIGVAAIVLNSTGVPIVGTDGAHTWQPSSLAQTQHSYRTRFGSATIDLSAVNFPRGGYTINASTAVGTLEVILPAAAVVSVNTNSGGSIHWENSQGWSLDGLINPSYNSQQATSAPHLNLNLRVGFGSITVLRSQSSK